jgi:hypothetical protein
MNSDIDPPVIDYGSSFHHGGSSFHHGGTSFHHRGNKREIKRLPRLVARLRGGATTVTAPPPPPPPTAAEESENMVGVDQDETIAASVGEEAPAGTNLVEEEGLEKDEDPHTRPDAVPLPLSDSPEMTRGRLDILCDEATMVLDSLKRLVTKEDSNRKLDDKLRTAGATKLNIMAAGLNKSATEAQRIRVCGIGGLDR